MKLYNNNTEQTSDRDEDGYFVLIPKGGKYPWEKK